MKDTWAAIYVNPFNPNPAEDNSLAVVCDNIEGGRAAARHLSGIFSGDDILAIGFMDAARREFGLDIPRDLSVIGFDDIAMASWPSHALTTIRQLVDQMLDLVVAFVQSPVHKSHPKVTRIQGTLIERATAGPRRRAAARPAARVSA